MTCTHINICIIRKHNEKCSRKKACFEIKVVILQKKDYV
jgi:hypothetical protein